MTAVLLYSLLACTSDAGFDTGVAIDPGGTPDGATGAIFKGPMVMGGVVTATALDSELRPIGGAAEGSVSSSLGDYSIDLEHTGLIELVAEGEVFEEATGGEQRPTLRMMTYASLQGEGLNEVHLNLITDLSHVRLRNLLLEQVPWPEAQQQVEQEMFEALHLGFGERPEETASSLNPYGVGYAQSYILAASGVISQAGRDLEDGGDMDPRAFMDAIREDFGDDGQIAPELERILYDAEEALNPDLVVLSLGQLVGELDSTREIADPHIILDSDHDGLQNDIDNCRYVHNPEQESTGSNPWGDACDTRMTSISTDDFWGCGVLLTDGSVQCWDITEGAFGATAPSPLTYPEGQVNPWADAEGLGNSYRAVSVRTPVFCGIETDGDLDCWQDGGVALDMEGDFDKVVHGTDKVCGLERSGAVRCVDLSNNEIINEAGPYADLTMLGRGDPLGLRSADGGLEWVVGAGDVTLPTGAYARVEGALSGQGWACALDSAGAVTCFGDSVLVNLTPTGSGFTALNVNEHSACVGDASGLQCWNDPGRCPEVAPPPGQITSVSGQQCTTCGLDDDGFGVCWPRRWEKDNAP